MKAVRPRVSYADLERAPEDGRRYELYDGEVFVVPSPLPKHQVVALRIVEMLSAYVRRHGGFCVTSPIDIVFSDYDVLQPDVGMVRDVAALLTFGARHGFLKDALIGLISTALSDYRHLRSRVGLQRYSEAEITAKLAAAGFSAQRAHTNIGHNRWRMTFIARPPLVR